MLGFCRQLVDDFARPSSRSSNFPLQVHMQRRAGCCHKPSSFIAGFLTTAGMLLHAHLQWEIA